MSLLACKKLCVVVLLSLSFLEQIKSMQTEKDLYIKLVSGDGAIFWVNRICASVSPTIKFVLFMLVACLKAV